MEIQLDKVIFRHHLHLPNYHSLADIQLRVPI